MVEKAIVQVSVVEVTPTPKGRLRALVDVELLLDGVAFMLHGIQVVSVRHPETGEDATAVDLPRYRAPNGSWRPAVSLPEELEGPIADAVLERCCELGIARRVRPVIAELPRMAS